MIDANVFIGESLYENPLSPAELSRQMDKLKVDGAVVRPLKPVDMDLDKANQWIRGIQKDFPRLTAFGRINPLVPAAEEQTILAIEEYNLKGIHLHPWEENFQINSPKVDAVVAAARGKVPFYISSGFPAVSHPLQVQDLVSRHPDTLFLVSHGAQQDISGMSFEDALILAEEQENVVFDVSGVYRRDFIELLYNKAGEDRLVFGSCTPYMDMSLEINRISATHLPESVKEKIFSGNIQRILPFFY